MPDFSPPAHLSDRSKALWQAVVPSRCRSAGRLALTLSALEALDRADQAREEIAVTGLTTTTKTTGAIHLNPLAKLERESRQQFARIWSDMHLGWDCEIDGRSMDVFLRQQKQESDDALETMLADEPTMSVPLKPTRRAATKTTSARTE